MVETKWRTLLLLALIFFFFNFRSEGSEGKKEERDTKYETKLLPLSIDL